MDKLNIGKAIKKGSQWTQRLYLWKLSLTNWTKTGKSYY